MNILKRQNEWDLCQASSRRGVTRISSDPDNWTTAVVLDTLSAELQLSGCVCSQCSRSMVALTLKRSAVTLVGDDFWNRYLDLTHPQYVWVHRTIIYLCQKHCQISIEHETGSTSLHFTFYFIYLSVIVFE